MERQSWRRRCPPRLSGQTGSAFAQGVRLSLRIAPGEGFYGWGEWFNAFRRERGPVRLRAQESPSVLQGRQTYSTIPFFLSSRGYVFFLLNSHETAWRIDPQRCVLEIEAQGPPADYLVIHGPTFKQILETYTALTGRPPLPPRWTFGLWTTDFPVESQERILELAHEHRRRGVPLDAVILDYHWEERFHNFRWCRSLFLDPDGLVRDLKDLGVRLVLILTPFVNHRNLGLQKWVLNLLNRGVPRGH